MTDKNKQAKKKIRVPDLETFITNVNKKSHANGKKVRFGFTKRKRQN
ncbi:MAG: hypothetical protein WC369_01765 [Dehalococcoidales bacterium]|jgi:hypothetical protein